MARKHHDEDDDDKSDSVRQREEHRTRTQAESAANEQKAAQAEEKRAIDEKNSKRAAQEADDQLLAQYAGPIGPNDSRDDLLERIKKMREDNLPREYPPIGRTPEMEEQLSAEQKAGAAAVAAAQAELDRVQKARDKANAEAEGGKK